MSEEVNNTIIRKVLAATKKGLRWGDRHIPAGLRSLLGVAMMAGGLVGFLPVLGFWMLPIGAGLVALDIPPLRRRLKAWMQTRNRRREQIRGKNGKV